jgi:hypothetical protein
MFVVFAAKFATGAVGTTTEHGSFEPAYCNTPEFVGSNQGFNWRFVAVPLFVQ